MKILLINTNYGGGAGIACRRLHKALLANRYDSNLLILEKVKSPEEKNVHSIEEIISEKRGFWYFALLKFSNRLLNKLPTIFNKKAYINGPSSLFRIDKFAIYNESDIIHLHWVPKIISYKHVFADKKKIFFWTLHDMNPFTGGNHYTSDLDYSPFKNLLQKNCNKKKIYLKDANLTAVSPSKWLNGEAKQSEVFKNFEIRTVPNCLDTEVFKPLNKIQTREKLNINFPNKIFILFVAEDPNDSRKGMSILIKALNQIKNKEQFCLLIVGKKIDISNINIQVVQLGFIRKEVDLTDCYNAADFFVTPSIEDNLPNTILESLSCGTPVLAFNTGGIPDMVEHKINGYLADAVSPKNLVEGINWLFQNHNSVELPLNARNKVVTHFNCSEIVKQHVRLYESKFHSNE